jgi:hypothetical protein
LCNIIETDETYQTDHNLLKASINTSTLLNKQNAATIKRMNKRKIFDIDKMEKEDWKNFEKDIELQIDNSKLKQRYIDDKSRNYKWINSLWDELHTIIINARDNRNKFIYINKEKKKEQNKITKDLDKHNINVRFLLKLRILLKSKHNSETQSQLMEKQNKFNYIIKEYNENLTIEWDKLIDPSNNESIMSINQLIQKIRLKSKADELMLITESINTAIE